MKKKNIYISSYWHQTFEGQTKFHFQATGKLTLMWLEWAYTSHIIKMFLFI